LFRWIWVVIGGCEIDKAYSGPILHQDDGGKFNITLEFIRDMMQWFKDGKVLPKRYVWEIILGAYAHFEKESSMVDVILDKGQSIDVIGDVHGSSVFTVDVPS
jgi:serine/threonine-protein phosphatase 5